MIYWMEREWWLPSKLAAHRRLHFKDGSHPGQDVNDVNTEIASPGSMNKFPNRVHAGSRCRTFHGDQAVLCQTTCPPPDVAQIRFASLERGFVANWGSQETGCPWDRPEL